MWVQHFIICQDPVLSLLQQKIMFSASVALHNSYFRTVGVGWTLAVIINLSPPILNWNTKLWFVCPLHLRPTIENLWRNAWFPPYIFCLPCPLYFALQTSSVSPVLLWHSKTSVCQISLYIYFLFSDIIPYFCILYGFDVLFCLFLSFFCSLWPCNDLWTWIMILPTHVRPRIFLKNSVFCKGAPVLCVGTPQDQEMLQRVAYMAGDEGRQVLCLVLWRQQETCNSSTLGFSL